MKFAPGVSLAGLHILMRPVLGEAELIWVAAGIEDGATITCALGGLHGPTSWHYFGLALDFRSRYFSEPIKDSVVQKLKHRLPFYDVVAHSTHIHVEIGNALAAKHNLLPDGRV
jgi:hypothetical protein